MKKICTIVLLLFCCCSLHAQWAVTTPVAGSFAIANSKGVAGIYTDTTDDWLVQKAATLLQQDIAMVTGQTPELLHTLPGNHTPVIIIGSIARCAVIQQLAASKKISTGSLQHQWEAFQLQVLHVPMAGVSQALVITGSDKRGTAYGVFELSRQIGVSPWYWWADVPVPHKANLYIKNGLYAFASPAVQYRGIFINDEAPAFSGWAQEKFGGVNHKVYEKVFELLLRLKANYLWPAMWGNAFNDDDTLNPQLADRYGIVMGTSHHEPMLRAQQEWKRYGSGAWNYETNKAVLQQFWEKGIRNMGTHESIVTVGMRGDGDMPMTEGANIQLLENIVADQRNIITRVTGKNAAATPQLWALYKEVQAYYDKGMRVPDDITLLLCDDNWGNIRKLPALTDKPRAGGYGIYYHFDYVGDPRNYKWLNTNNITRTWEQLHLAYAHGVNRIWIVNVGDLKPMEYPISFFLDYAWNPDAWPASRLNEYAQQWAAQQFGNTWAKSIAHILTAYTQYNSRRKPELLAPETYSLLHYSEAEKVVAEYNRLCQQAEAIAAKLPAAYQAAYVELVLHPVKACANINELYVAAAKNRLYAQQQRSTTNAMADSVRRLYNRDSLLSLAYNTLLQGKWNHMMDQTHIGYTYWQQPAVNTMPAVQTVHPAAAALPGIAVEGSAFSWPLQDSLPDLPVFDVHRPGTHYIELYNRGSQPYAYSITAGKAFVQVQQSRGTVQQQQRINIGINWLSAPRGITRIPLYIVAGDKKAVIYAVINNPAEPQPGSFTGTIEAAGYISLAASAYTKAVGSQTVQWQTLPHIGRTGDGITAIPVTAAPVVPGAGQPHLEYPVYLYDSVVQVQAYLSPTLDFNNSGGLRYAVSFDNEAPQIINLHAGQTNRLWEQWVADNINIQTSTHHLKPGPHVLKYWLVDAGIVLQKLVINGGGVHPAYLGPPEQ